MTAIGNRVIHVIPATDLIDHDTSAATGTSCICGPSSRVANRPDGSTGWVVTHASLDGPKQQG